MLSPGKASSHSSALPSYLFPSCAAFSFVHTTGCEAYSFTTDGYGIINMRIHVGACRTHAAGSGTKTSAQDLTRGDRNNTCTSPCPARGSNPGPSRYVRQHIRTHVHVANAINASTLSFDSLVHYGHANHKEKSYRKQTERQKVTCICTNPVSVYHIQLEYHNSIISLRLVCLYFSNNVICILYNTDVISYVAKLITHSPVGKLL